MAKPLTAKQVEIERPSSKRREIPDGLLPGLYFIVQPSGAKSWAVRSRLLGRTKKHTIGKFPAISLADARERARAILRDFAENKDPRKGALIEAESPADFGEMVEEYIKRYVIPNNRPTTAAETSRLLRKEILPAWQGRSLVDVQRVDVVRLLDDLSDRGLTVGANRVLAALRRFFNWCRERGHIEVSPCEGVRPPATEVSRDRVLADWELRYVLRAARVLSWPFGTLVELLVYTGQRRSEVSGLRWHELNEDQSLWIIPQDRSKNGKAHHVPLSQQAQKLLSSVPVVKSSAGFVLTTTGTSPISGFSRAKRQLEAQIKALMTSEGQDSCLEPWTLHDLRRTVATGMARQGISLPVIERILNHTSGSFAGVVAVYQRYAFDEEKRQALQLWGSYVDRLCAEEATNNVGS